MTLSSKGPDVPESFSLRCERKETPASNSTLIYNNTVYIISHSVNHRSRGTNYCMLRFHGKEDIYSNQTQQVSNCEYAVFTASVKNTRVKLSVSLKRYFKYTVCSLETKYFSKVSTVLYSASHHYYEFLPILILNKVKA